MQSRKKTSSSINTLKNIGKLIQTLRQEKGITQSEFAERLKTTQSAVARIEKGQQNPSAVMLSRINKALGSDVVGISQGRLNIKVTGRKKLRGSIVTKSSKNGAVGLLCASLLNHGQTTLENVPRIEEVFRIIEVMESIGASVTWQEKNLHIVPPKTFTMDKINRDSATKTRSVLMFIGSLSNRMNSFSLPRAGGCKLGSRSVKPHVYCLEEMGIKIKSSKSEHDYLISYKKRKAREIVLYESGDTVTENALMAASGIEGVTTIKYASANYQVQDLCFYLEKIGVKIEGIGTTTLKVYGIKHIDKDVSFAISEDPIESMFFISAAILTDSTLTIERAPINFLELELYKLKKMGLRYSLSKKYKAINGKTDLCDITVKPSKLKALAEKIEPRPYPGLNIDNLPFFAVIATKAEGQTFIHDWVFEERAIYYKELDKLGAETLLADPHRVYINGKTPLLANEVICPPALRPAAIILIGMLGASGTSVLRNIYSINRGYEDVINRLNKAGAQISVISDL